MWDFFSLERYMPHAICFAEDPDLIVTHVGSDAVIALSYFSIPLAIMYFAKERKDLEFKWIAHLFILFILWCGITHVADLVTIWYPIYGVQATAKMLTALASVSTAIVVWAIMPQLIALPSPGDLKTANRALQDEIEVRREAETNLRRARDELEARVAERTEELQDVNRRLREQSRFLESIIGNAGSAIWVKGIDNRYQLVNDEWSKITGISRDRAIGFTDHDILPSHMADAFVRNDRLVIATRRPLREEEPLTTSEEIQAIVSTKFPILSEGGEVVAVGGIATDVTALKSAQTELLEVNKQLIDEVAMRERAQIEQAEYARQLEISNTELDSFAHTASHDLKEPLRGISHYATFALEDHEDDLPEDVKSRLIDIRTMASRLQGMIDSLYRLAKSGRHWNPVNRVNIGDCAKVAVETLSSYIATQDAAVKIAEKMPTMRVDPEQVQQLYRNLIANGIKYNHSEAKTVDIGWVRSVFDLPDGDALSALRRTSGPVFFVRDNGIGIPEKSNSEIFTVFRKLSNKDDNGESHGVGLSIAKRIVDRHGGTIWTRPVEGGGSVFYFTLSA